MISQEVTIINKLGLHARAAAKFVTLASNFECNIQLSRNEQKVNAKSIMGVMMLAAGKGSTLLLTASGNDEEEAVQQLQTLINHFFGEGE